jgi:hypothetical protein
VSEASALGDRRLSEEFNRLRSEIPEVVEHRQAFRILKADFSYIRKYQDQSWVTLLSPGPDLSARFGLTRDVMLIYSPAHELQPAVLRQVAQRRDALPSDRSCEDHFVLVSSNDPMAGRKLDSWMVDEPILGVHLPRAGRPDALALGLRKELLRKLASRNLYDETLPVTGSDFFGRRRELTQLQEELRQGKVCGVFGLRKTGKTSLVKELGRRFTADDSNRIFVLRDLESLPNQSPRIRVEMIQELRQGFLTGFREKEVRRGDLANLELDATVGDFKRAMKSSLTDCEKRGIQVVLALDEIEYLVGDAHTLERGDRPEVPEILGALRSLVQEHSSFNVVLSGITSSIVHRGALYGVENPLFNWAKVYYIQPMSRSEIQALTTDVGRRMAVTWSPAALDDLYAVSSGNVFLHRTLAAEVTARMEQDTSGFIIDTEHVSAARRPWRRKLAERLEQMFLSFERHYPAEAGLLRLAASGDATLDEIDSSYAAETNRLVELSLVEETVSGDLKLGPLAAILSEAGVI